MAVALDGLVSGLDTSSIIDSLVSAAGAGLTRYKQQLADVELKKDHWETMKGHLTSLYDAINAINESSELKAMTATSADTGLLDAEVTGTALAGTYSVNVTQLAAAQTSKSTNSFASGSSTFTADTSLEISVNGAAAVSVDLSSDLTLDGVIAAINDANLGIQAYKVQQADGTYILMATGEETGADYDFTFSLSDQTFSDITTAQDTLATVNGVSVKSSNTTISGVIPGVDLTAYDETGGAVDVVVGIDRSKVKDNIEDFVSKYNTVLAYISYEVSVNDASEEAGPLSGDNTLRQIQRSLQDDVRSEYTSNTYINSLAALGITTKKDGSLEIDDTDLTDALNDHFAEVIGFFTDDDGFFSALTNVDEEGTLDFMLDSTDGTVANKMDSLDEQIENYNETIERETTRLENLEETLRAKFTAMEVALSKLKATQDYVSATLGSSSSSSKSK